MDQRLVGHFNWLLLFLVLMLDVVGLTNLYSAVQQENSPGLARLFTTQVIYVSVGLLILVLVTAIDYRVYERTAYVLYGFGLSLLLTVLISGRIISGSKRWLDLGLFSLQPSELCKPLLVFALAKYFHHDMRPEGYRLRDLLRPFLITLPALVLIFVSPDLGTTGFYLLIFVIIAFSVGLQWRSLFLIGAFGLITLPLAYEFLLTDYQRSRVHTLLDPTHDPLGKGYQILQARYAIGAGRFFGTGYLQGMQTHQGFIPENQTDFIVTVLAEEWGFIGCVVLLLIYYLILMLGLRAALQSKERFGTILATGIVAIFFLQISINLSAVLGMIPVTGVTLPLMSYGGSSVLVLHGCVGLLLNISMRRYMF